MTRCMTEYYLNNFREHLYEEEKSPATIRKYMCDLGKLGEYAGKQELTKRMMIEFKEQLKQSQKYQLSSINSFLAAANSFFDYMGWHDLKVKAFRIQKDAFIPENKDLTKMAEECNMDTSVIFRWKTGKVLPGSWERLEVVIEKLRLTPYEISGLKRAYRKEVLGANQSRYFDEIVETIQILGEAKRKCSAYIQKEMSSFYEIHFRDSANTGCGFLEMNGETEVWQCMQNLLEMMSTQKSRRLCLKLHVCPETLLMQLKQFGSKMSEGRLEVLICDDDKTGDIIVEKLRRLKEMANLLAQENHGKIYCGNLWYTEERQGNWIMAEDLFMQFSDDMSLGMLTRDAEWIAFFRESFDQMAERCELLYRKKMSWAEYIEGEGAETYQGTAILGYMPWVGNILANQEEFSGDGLEGVPGDMQLLSCFTREGLLEFLENESVEQGANFLYEPLALRQRCELLERAISLAEQRAGLRYLMLKEEVFDMKGVCVSLRDGKREALRLEIRLEKDGIEEIEVVDADIIKGYRNFFKYLLEENTESGKAKSRRSAERDVFACSGRCSCHTVRQII